MHVGTILKVSSESNESSESENHRMTNPRKQQFLIETSFLGIISELHVCIQDRFDNRSKVLLLVKSFTWWN